MAGWKKISIKIWLLAFWFCIFCSGKVLAAQAENSGIRAEDGIVEVQSGFLDHKGKFRNMKSGSGFLIANKTNDTYVITNSSNVSNTQRAIKKYCKKHSIDTENMQLVNHIQIVVKGDVTAEAQVVAQSVEKDYCVLSAANVVSQKAALKLGDSEKAAVNDLVYAYGFLKETGGQEGETDYSDTDVKVLKGIITENETYADKDAYLMHTAPVVQGYAGGPLLDEEGYVVGLNCKPSQEDDAGIAYALPINEISTLLDNFSIYYGSRAIDEAYEKLETAYEECVRLTETGGYKRASVEALQQVLEETGEVLSQEAPYAEELEKACQKLLAAKAGLLPKTTLLTNMIRILAVCDLVLLFWVLVLAVKNGKEKKQMISMQQYPRLQAQSSARKLRMVRKKTEQSVAVNKNQFVIGKNQSEADYCIMDNKTVSRKHAVLFEKNGSWYVSDLNSLNGTYVNGSRILPGQAVLLKGGDELMLSDEGFLIQG